MAAVIKTMVDFHAPAPILNQQILSVCKQADAAWESVHLKDCKVEKITGGITNVLYKLVPPADSKALKPLAVKVFGDKTEMYVDRDKEAQVLVDLNRTGFGPKVLAVFGNGRVEVFLNCKTLEAQDMVDPRYMYRIAQKLRLLHDSKVKVAGDGLFATIRKWLELARSFHFTEDAAKQAVYEKIDFDAYLHELQEVAAACKLTQSPIVFAHADLLAGNILILLDHADIEHLNAMQFIDFEYSFYCERGFDFGNHFNEYAGFNCDYTRYPSADKQKEFFSAYLRAYDPTLNIPAKQLDDMVAEANVFSLVSHMYWGVWAILQAYYSPVQFEFLPYSKLRWDRYFATKNVYLEQVYQCFGSQQLDNSNLT